jgi:hypothetical protein
MGKGDVARSQCAFGPWMGDAQGSDEPELHDQAGSVVDCESEIGKGIREADMSDSNQNLRRDLQGVAADLKWSAVELVRIAERLSQAGNEPDAQALHRMIAVFHREEIRLQGIVHDVAAGLIVKVDSVSV